MAIDISRSILAFNPDKAPSVVVVGLGAVGSKVIENLVSLGMHPRDIVAYDFDKVEEHNIGNQAFYQRHIGMYKADAMRELCEDKTGISKDSWKFHNLKLETLSLGREYDNKPVIVFLAVDGIDTRAKFVNDHQYNPAFFIDVRVGFGYGFVYTFSDLIGDTTDRYKDTLFEVEEVDTGTACGTSQTINPVVNVLSSIAVQQMMNLMKGYQAPFKHHYITKPMFMHLMEK